MKYQNRYFTLLVTVLLLIGLFGCSKDSTDPEPVPINEFNVLLTYIEGDGGDYLNSTAQPKIVTASAVAPSLADYKIIDVRSQADYDSSHVIGAVHVALADVITYAEANLSATDKILVACYTGQSAGHAVLALNLVGWDAYSLKFGMSSADTSLDKWSSNCTSDFLSSFTTTTTGKNAEGGYPTLSTAKTSGSEILADRVQAILEAGFKGKNAVDVLANPTNYYIVNYFSEADYLGQGNCPPGHIDGATQYTPKADLKTTAFLNTLPTDMPIVVYCWTGQNSSQVTAWLNILGYEAYSLKFGVNGMVYDQLTGSKWSSAAITGLPLVP